MALLLLPVAQGVAKLDLLAPKTQKECAVATIEYADGGRGGEAYFVPRQEAKGECPCPLGVLGRTLQVSCSNRRLLARTEC